MKYPAKRAAAMRTLTIPDLAGGINTRDSITDILDNQLNSARNMWYRNGALRTRPAAECYETAKKIITTGPQANKRQELSDSNTKEINTGIVITVSDKKYKLSAIAFSSEDASPDRITVSPVLTGENDVIKLNDVYVSKTQARSVSNMRLFFAEYGGTIYLFNGEKRKIHTLNIGESVGSWRTLSDSEIYAPLVVLGLSAFGEDSTKDKAPKGTLVDGYNLIGRYYKAEYTTVNKELLDLTNASSTHKMCYLLPNSINGQGGFTVSVEYTAPDGNYYSHSAEVRPIYDGNDHITGYEAEETEIGADGKRIKVEDTVLKFLTSESGATEVIATVTASDLVRDNMTVTAPVQNGQEDKVFYNSFCEWFGGSAEGISGGTRLFLGGNSKRAEQSAIVWSALNNPLYFPENNYSNVGESASAVTAFGKQSNMLIIFKENEVWATQYASNKLSAEAVDEQSVIDTQSAIAYFPLTLLSAQTGCNLPGTVQLCANRLVWANKDGKVYTLVTENQYSEKNIYAVSEMIRDVLSTANLNKNAKSADYEGAYWLFFENTVYVMDYESYGFRYISSYSKTEDAGVRIPWWVFELPGCLATDVSCVESTLIMTVLSKIRVGQNVHHYLDFIKFNRSGENDIIRDYTSSGIPDGTETRPMPTTLETKVFEFNAPQYNKNIHGVDLGVRANGGTPIRVSYMTESTERTDDDYIVCAVNASERSSRNIQNIQLRPGLHGCSRFGLRLECEGGMSINHISINYTITGGAK